MAICLFKTSSLWKVNPHFPQQILDSALGEVDFVIPGVGIGRLISLCIVGAGAISGVSTPLDFSTDLA